MIYFTKIVKFTLDYLSVDFSDHLGVLFKVFCNEINHITTILLVDVSRLLVLPKFRLCFLLLFFLLLLLKLTLTTLSSGSTSFIEYRCHRIDDNCTFARKKRPNFPYFFILLTLFTRSTNCALQNDHWQEIGPSSLRVLLVASENNPQTLSEKRQ